MKTLITICVLSIAISANAQSSQNLTLADSGMAQVAPRTAYHEARAYLAFINSKAGANGDIMFASRASDEQSFSTPVAVTNTGKINGTLQRGPEFAIAPDGTIHMVWMEERYKANPDIFYSRGTINGTQWTEPEDISRDGQIASQDFPSIAVDSSGNEYVAWIDSREIVQGKSTNEHIFLTRSFDGGMTWDTPKHAEKNPGLIGGSCECCRTAIAASPDGDVYIAYRTNMDHVRDIFIARSNDKGENFDMSIRASTKEWILHACPATGPMITLDKLENLHIVYRCAYSNKAVVYYNLLPKGFDKTFTEIPLTPVSGSSANYADIAVTPNGGLNVVYQQGGWVSERTSTDGGNSWMPAVKLDSVDGTQMYPTVEYFASRGILTSMWQDDRRDRGDVMGLDRPFAPTTTLPTLLFVNNMAMGDSARISWAVADDGPTTWYLVEMKDTSFITTGNSVIVPRTFVDRSPVSVTPKTAIGDGEKVTVAALSVSERSSSNALMLSKLPVVAGDRISMSLNDAREIHWTIYDLQGRNCGVIVSTSHDIEHELQVPALAPGVYYLRSDVLGQNIKLVVAAK